MSTTLKLPPGMRVEFDDPAALEDPRNVAMLRDLIERVHKNPLLKFFPHDKQQPFLATRKPIKVFVGGERSGKTLTGEIDNILQAVDREIVPEHLQAYKIWEPPFYCRIITPDFGQSYAEILRTLQEWIPREQYHLGKWEAAFSEKNHILNFANGSFFEFMTQKQDVTQFGGTSRHRIHWDEEPKGVKGEELREANAPRLIQYRGDELFTFSPVNGLGAIGDDLWEQRGEEVAREVFVGEEMILVVADQDDNPHLDEEGKREAMAKIPERMRAARKSGKFVHSAGLVYEDFSRDLHVVPRLDPKFVAGLERMEAIDPGLNTGVQFGAFEIFESEGERLNLLWIYDELFLKDSDAIPANVAAQIFAKRKEWGVGRPRRTLIDPWAGAKQHQTNQKTEDLYRDAGIKVRQANNDVDAGVFELMRRLVHRAPDGSPRPLILIAENCKRTLWEKGRYRKERNADGELEIVKEHDHLMDCERYLANEKRLPKIKKPGTGPDRRLYVPGTAAPISAYRKQEPTPVMGRFS